MKIRYFSQNENFLLKFDIKNPIGGGGLLPPLSPGGVNEYINKKERLNATKTRCLAFIFFCVIISNGTTYE